MFKSTKKEFIVLWSFSGLIAIMVQVLDHTKWISFNKQPWITRPTLHINPDEYSRSLCYYLFLVKI